MLPWFLRNSQRLDREREAVEDLVTRATWLVGHQWLVEGGSLCLDLTIRIGQRDFKLKLTYPSAFPNAPAIVRPIGEEARLSGHQYGGPDGPLCLEWGPDNWHPDVTAADLIGSTHSLLATERIEDAPDTRLIDAPSRHRLTQGQALRSALVRWYVTEGLLDFLTRFAPGLGGEIQCSLRGSNGAWVSLVHSAKGPDGAEWQDPEIPDELPGATLRQGRWVKSQAGVDDITAATTLEALEELVGKPGESSDDDPRAVLVLDTTLAPHLNIVVSDGELIKCRAVRGAPGGESKRAPDAPLLESVRIGVVGLGSVGSKIAVSLARMGATALYFVDHDVLLPENLRRHSLDWQGVGLHKVDAAAQAVSWINSNAKVEVDRLHLTGQESPERLNSVLDRLGRCQLVVDATGNPAVFNLLSAVCEAGGVTLVWVEVFGGGIGGVLGRSRVGVDPRPQDVRAAYLNFCDANPAPSHLARAIDYEIASPSADEPLVASDSDVAILAHLGARMVVDAFRPEADTQFAESLYLVGLSEEWVFREAPSVMPLYTSTPAQVRGLRHRG